MTYLKEIKKELKEKGKLENLTKGNVQALQQAYIKDNPQCENCGVTKNLSYDHIIPVTILIDFNVDGKREFWEQNSQTLCFRCNVRKAHTLDLTNPKTAINLMYLLNQLN